MRRCGLATAATVEASGLRLGAQARGSGAVVEAAELVEAVDAVEVGQELGQLVGAEQLRLRRDLVDARGLEDMDDPGRNLPADLLVAAGAGEQE